MFEPPYFRLPKSDQAPPFFRRFVAVGYTASRRFRPRNTANVNALVSRPGRYGHSRRNNRDGVPAEDAALVAVLFAESGVTLQPEPAGQKRPPG